MSEQLDDLAKEDKTESQFVTLPGIISETEKLSKAFLPIQHENILNSLLNEIHPINFREKVGFDSESERLSKKHYIICCIDEILDVAKKNYWGLCRNGDFIYLYNGCYWSLIDYCILHTKRYYWQNTFNKYFCVYRENLLLLVFMALGNNRII